MTFSLPSPLLKFPSEKWRSIDRFVNFSVADVKSFSEKQENVTNEE